MLREYRGEGQYTHIVVVVTFPGAAVMSRSSILLLALIMSATSVGAAAPKVGYRHPDFTLANNADGKPVSLSDFRGKKVLLIQFASW